MMIDRIPPLLSNCLALFAIYYFLVPAPAYGYFDLGTGTFMIQTALMCAATVWLSLRTSWLRIGGKKKAVTNNNQDSIQAPPSDLPKSTDSGQTEAAKNES